MKIAVTGAAGHIGSEICRQLIARGHEVVALVHHNIEAIEGLDLKKVNGGLLDKEVIKGLIGDCDAVIHTAGKIGLDYKFDQSVYDVNVKGSELLFDTAYELGIKKLIHFSSIQAFNPRPFDIPVDENREFTNDDAVFYDRTKRDSHKLALEYAAKGLDILVICPTSAVGPPDFIPSKLGKAVIDIYNRSIPAVVKGGFNFADVRDIAAGTIDALDRGKKGETYILGGKYYTIQDFANTILEIKGSKRRLVELPLFLAYIGLPFVQTYAKLTGKEPLYDKTYLDILQSGNQQIIIDKARHELNYEVRELGETLQDAIKWFRDTGKL